MTPERWRRVEELYHAALAQPVERRSAFVAEGSVGDTELQREVESLLTQNTAGVRVFERRGGGSTGEHDCGHNANW
jgi:hypothetical protein